MAQFLTFITVQELILCCSIVFFASIMQVSIGMGFGMLASPLIALIRPDLVPGSILTMGLLVAFAGAWRERKNISFTELKLGVGGRVLGSFCAIIVLSAITDVSSFYIVFGSLMLLTIGLTISGIQVAFTNRNLLGLSVVSGLVGSITAVGAPPMAVIYHNRAPTTVRPTLNAFFFSGSVLGLFSLGFTGWLGVEDLIAAIYFLPAMLLGIRCADPFMRLPTQWLSRILLTLSAIASISLIFRGFSL